MPPVSSTAKLKKIKPIKTNNLFFKWFWNVDQTIKYLNSNTIFVGLMMFVANIASRFVNIKLSKSMEGFMKHSFSKNILVFAIAFIGTRDLYWALVITLVFVIFMDFIFNEDSSFCCLTESFTSKHIALLKTNEQDKSTALNPTANGGNSISPAMGLGYSTGSKTQSGHQMHKTSTVEEQQNSVVNLTAEEIKVIEHMRAQNLK